MRNIWITTVTCLSVSPLAGQSSEFGEWISLFNGKDTTGWVKAKEDQVPGQPNRWGVEDGALTNTQTRRDGNDVCTAEEFEDYELELEYRIPEMEDRRGNSGVYLRGLVEVQIADSHGKPAEATGAGGIFKVAPPLENTARPAGEWNHFRILHIGHRISVWHNGVYVIDNAYRDSPNGGEMKIHSPTGHVLDGAKGPIMLQGNHSKVWFRNLRIRRLFPSEDGWRPLWNGVDLSGFNGTTGSSRHAEKAKDGLRWKVEDHSFTNEAFGSGGHDLWTDESFGNFLVHYAYKSDRTKDGGNSGFYLRNQWEIQIHSSPERDVHADGALYSIHAGVSEHLTRNGPDQWNHMDVKLKGPYIWVWQNGTLIHAGRVCDTRTDNHGTKTDPFLPGPFKFQGDHGKVWFTDLYIKPLADVAR